MITESRLKSGTLTLTPPGGGGSPAAFATQATNVRITPSYEDQGEALEVLSGDTLDAEQAGTYALAIGAIQDFTDPAGFVAFTWEHELEVCAFTWKPNADGPTFAGNVTVLAAEVGGDVNARLTTEVTWALTAKPTISYSAG